MKKALTDGQHCLDCGLDLIFFAQLLSFSLCIDSGKMFKIHF